MNEIIKSSNEAIAKGSQSFALAARLLPKSVREDTVMLYAWCRYADDVIDGQEYGHSSATITDREAALSALRENTRRALHCEDPLPAPFQALRIVARRHDIPEAWPFALIDGFEMDVNGRAYQSLEDTLDYAYHVAGVVGLMMARVMGVRDDDALDRACDLGLAFQLTNIARDVMDDAKIGRVYLPQAWLEEAGIEIDGDIPSDALYALILRLLDVAEGYYASAQSGLKALPARASWSIASAARIYQAIGTEIRKGGARAYQSRIHTSTARKLWLVARASRDHFARAGSEYDRKGLWQRVVVESR